MRRVCSRTSSGALPSISTTGVGRSGTLAGMLVLFLSLATPTLAEVEAEMVRGVERATSELSDRFREIRRDVLGADALAAEYRRVGFDYSSLNISAILSTDYAMERIDTVLRMMMSVNASSSSDTQIPSDCCEGNSRSEVCCHGCSSNLTDPLLSAVTDSLSTDPSLENIRVELQFGRVDGTLLRYPTPQPPPTDQCFREDSNLQPWYMSMIRSRPLEIVLVVDLSEFKASAINTAGLRSAALAVLNSLTRQDKVQVLLVGQKVLRFSEDSGSNKVLPACASYLQQLRTFIQLGSPSRAITNPAAYVDAFRAAFNFLQNSSDADKLILFFTTVSNQYVPSNDHQAFNMVLRNVTQLNQARGNSVVISSYYNGPFPLNRERLADLVNQPIAGTLTELGSEYDVRGYYNMFSSGTVRTQSVDRDINSRGDSSLSLSLSLKNGSDLIGVFRALLPWEMLFPNVEGRLESGRGSSHFFVVNGAGEVLYHPLVPGDFQLPVSVASLESQDLMDPLMESPATEFTVKSTKLSLAAVSVRSREENSFISREVAVTYSCRPLPTAMATLYVCVVVADEDLTTAQLKDAKIGDLYNSNPGRVPLYHTSDIPEDDKCFYFCSISSTDELSVQLTGPSKPPADVELPDLVKFLQGTPAATSWAEKGVANELGVVSVIGDTWKGGMSNVTDYVVRRHLATPSGLYLAHPFARLNPDFVAPATEWFVLSAAHPHDLTLTLTPPRPDTIWGAGHIVSIGTALSAPPQDGGGSGGELLAVVAADLTLPALRALVMEALPLCNNDYNCFLLDDQGNILYHELLFTSEFQAILKEPVFFVQTQAPPEFREMFISILNESVALKLRCIDYLNQTVRQRLFFSFDVNMEGVHAVSSNGIDYAIKNIPGTNAFLGIVRKSREIRPFCFCTKNCQTCGNNERGGCECPCLCREDCTTPHSFPACPITYLERDQLASDGALSTVSTDRDIPDVCFPLDCSCKTEENDCAASRDCHWCPQLGLCRHVYECCTTPPNTAGCCSQSPFTQFPSCITSLCSANIDPPRKECVHTASGTKNGDVTASIVGGVLGALLVLVLVLIGAAFILWAKFCKKGLYEDEQKENNFDFSNSKPKAKNPLNEEQVKEDVEVENLTQRSSSQKDITQSPAGDDTPL